MAMICLQNHRKRSGVKSQETSSMKSESSNSSV